MNDPIDELVTYADHTQGCMVAAGHDECICGYDDAEGNAQAAWEALKAENARLTRERDEAFRMSRCECGPDECCANLVKLHEENARLAAALQELVALVRGECPRLLDEDRDGDARLSIEIDAALSAVPSDSPADVKTPAPDGASDVRSPTQGEP